MNMWCFAVRSQMEAQITEIWQFSTHVEDSVLISLPVVSPDPALTFLDCPLSCPHSHSECVSVSLGLRLMWVLG